MKIVITGALGHIGSRLIRETPGLVPSVDMVLVDNLSAAAILFAVSPPGIRGTIAFSKRTS
jgi:dTDP-D-glucose 4,6-dehydratase